MSYKLFLMFLMASTAARDYVFADGMMGRKRWHQGREGDIMRVDGIRFEGIACCSLLP